MSDLNTRQRIAILGIALCVGLLAYRGCDGVGIRGGATYFVLLHAAENTDARFGELKQEIQDASSPVAKAIAEAGWRVDALDDNAVDGQDQPHPLLKKLGVYDSIDDKRRELLSIAPPDTLVDQEPIPADATADSVLTMIQARGKR